MKPFRPQSILAEYPFIPDLINVIGVEIWCALSLDVPLRVHSQTLSELYWKSGEIRVISLHILCIVPTADPFLALYSAPFRLVRAAAT